jgi:ribosome maturation protein SDO1
LAVSIDKAVIARLSASGQKFEILVDPNKALEFKKGKMMNMNDILAYPVIYHDVRNTETVAKEELQKAFGTSDVYKIAERIIKTGELQLTTEQRREMVEQKRNQIAAIISKRSINPQTNTPHPMQRILNAINQTGVSIDPFIDAELQLDKIVNAIKPLLPIRFQKVTLQIKVSPQFSGRVYSILKESGSMKQEQWQNDGSLQLTIEILAGVQDDLTQKVAGLTSGNFELKIIKREDV